jgi:hypothetical protein
MRKALSVFIIGLWAWSAIGQAAPFDLPENLLKAYRFVAAKVSDPVEREACGLRVDFRNLKPLHFDGFTPRPTNGVKCPGVIQIDLRLEQDWQSGLVMAHELVHLFRNYKTTHDAAWLEEGLANLIEHQYLGLGPITLADQLLEVDEFVLDLDWSHYVGDSSSYAMAYFFALYLYNHFGEDTFLREWMTSPLTGWDAIEQAARNARAKGRINLEERWLDRDSIWTHFSFALLLNDSMLADHNLLALDPRYKALASLQSKLLRTSFETGPRAIGERLRYYRWSAVNTSLATLASSQRRLSNSKPIVKGTSRVASELRSELDTLPFTSDVAWYVVKTGPQFQIKAFDEFSALAEFAKNSVDPFDYLIEVRFSPREVAKRAR